MMMMMMKHGFVERIVIEYLTRSAYCCAKRCLQRLFECAFCTALISELVWKRIPDGRMEWRKCVHGVANPRIEDG